MIEYLDRKRINVNRIKNENQSRIIIVDPDLMKNICSDWLLQRKHWNGTNKNYLWARSVTRWLLFRLWQIILVGDFNLFFDPSLEASGAKPASKKKRWISKLVQVFE